ncbi:MAG TPA: hypothetical protein PLU02_13310 [Chitinophagales bacterium]|nr:hypothetical protein [Chitinophagales bacterium]
MKKHICTFIAYLLLVLPLAAQQHMVIDLQNWQFRKVGDTTSWIKATVPGCVHTDLLNAGIIADPFFGSNEKTVEWVEREDWEYQTFFEVKNKFLKNDFINIRFEGLDTYADVYLNDSLILQNENMFVEHTIDVKNLLQKGVNKLYIKFYSSVNKAKMFQQQYPVPLPGEERVFVRKAQYQFGWDWGPRLVTAGIWKPVTLFAEDNIRVKDADINFLEEIDNTAKIDVKLNFQANNKSDYKIVFKEITTDTVLYAMAYYANFPTTEHFSVTFPITKRWYPNGYGEQSMYSFKLQLVHKNKVLFEKNITTGFSNIKLIQQKDDKGESFYFTVNGTTIFAKGANLIPLNSFSPAATHEHYRKIVTEAKNMNMNMIRVWGGGIYESDYLYNLCDSLGILIWQDFMFACAMYPNAPQWETEFTQQVNRLKHHPCLALWCGNNENDEGWKNWGWQKQFNYSDADSAFIAQANSRLFNEVIPRTILSATNKYPNYHASSPLHGWGRKESLTNGDAHYWGVWWGKQPFTVFNEKIPRFMSEYGFQGMPPLNAFKQFIPENELYLGSPSVKNHQKHPVGYETIQEYMEREFRVPEQFEDYIYVSQLLQAKGMQIAIEAHRRNRPYCMGTLFWQLNDCWPVTSWSTIDYYFNRKAAYYAVKKAYADVLISVIEEKGNLSTWLINDKLVPVDAELSYTLMTTKGIVIETNTQTIKLKAASSELFATINTKYFLKGYAPENCVLYIVVKQNNMVLAETFHLFTPTKMVNLQEPEITMLWNTENNAITISSNTYVAGLYLYTDQNELQLSDNFFDLLPSTPKEISLQGKLAGESQPAIKFKTLNTLYK